MAQDSWPEQVEEALALQAILGPDFEALGTGEVTAEAGEALLAGGPPPGGARWRILIRLELPPEGVLLQVRTKLLTNVCQGRGCVWRLWAARAGASWPAWSCCRRAWCCT